MCITCTSRCGIVSHRVIKQHAHSDKWAGSTAEAAKHCAKRPARFLSTHHINTQHDPADLSPEPWKNQKRATHIKTHADRSDLDAHQRQVHGTGSTKDGKCVGCNALVKTGLHLVLGSRRTELAAVASQHKSQGRYMYACRTLLCTSETKKHQNNAVWVDRTVQMGWNKGGKADTPKSHSQPPRSCECPESVKESNHAAEPARKRKQ